MGYRQETVYARLARKGRTWLWANHVPPHTALIWHPHAHRIGPDVFLFEHVALLPARAPWPSLLLCGRRCGLRKKLRIIVRAVPATSGPAASPSRRGRAGGRDRGSVAPLVGARGVEWEE
jgi:hypothetical protein